MATLDTLFASEIDGISIIQDGVSTLKVENKKATYENPFGNNEPQDLGAGQQQLSISFKLVNDQDISSMVRSLRDKRKVNVIDKYKGEFSVEITSFEQEDSDSSIGVTKFRVTMEILEVKKNPIQDIGSVLDDDALSLEDAIDITLALDTVNLIDDAINSAEDSVDAFNNSANFANNSIESLGRYKASLKKINDTLPSTILLPDALKSDVLNVISGYKTIFATSKDERAAAAIIPTYEPVDTTSNSNFIKTQLENRNVIGNATNIAKCSLLVGAMTGIDFKSKDEALTAQDDIEEVLNNITGNDQLVEKIKNDVSIYIQSLDLPEVVEIQVFQKPMLVIAYDMYGDTSRVEDLKDLNGLIEDDNLTGTIKVFSK